MMLLWWIIPLLLVLALMDRRSEASAFRGANASTWVLVLLGVLLLGGFGMGFNMMGYGHMGGWGGRGGFGSYGGFGGFGWMGIIVHLLVVGLVIWGVLAYFKRHGKGSVAGTGVTGEPEEIRVLKLRLAKGEITPEEYDVLRQKLQG